MIRGAKGGESESRTPVESPDSLVSIAYARVVDLISEGEVGGLVNGAQSIFLNETPAETNGVRNFSGFTFDTRVGTQDQTHLPGFPQVESETVVNVEVTTGIPYVRAVTNSDLSAIRINFSVPRLVKQNQKNGDLTGTYVGYAIDVAMGSGPFVEVLASGFNGKTTGGYERSERIDLTGAPVGGWRVRVRRTSADSTSSAITDAFFVKSVTEIIDAKFRYPNSAIVGVSFDAQTFGGQIPKRAYHMRGLIIRVPSNYDPVTRSYSGVWDGTFKTAYSNNPAWVYFDLLINRRYGLGERINAAQIDKWGLYQIAQFCDELVDDGLGGQEPRFTCNAYIQKQVDALRLLQDIASIFRGMTYWGAGQAYVSADMPSDPVYTYTNANVIGGRFSYKGSKRSTRYSVALVSWTDPNDFFRQKTEYVPNDEAIGRFGVREVQISAFACSSQGQAQRAGRWSLLTNLLETETVNFSVGLEGIKARPGQIIRVADNDRAGRRIGGRVHAATLNSITVDSIGLVEDGDEITVITPAGEAETRTVQSVAGRTITVTVAFSAAPLPASVWAVDAEALATQLFRIIAIGETGPLEYSITATKHIPGKSAAVDSGTIISTRPITSIPNSVQAAPTNVRAQTDFIIDQYAATTTMSILWDAAEGATSYDAQWRRGNSDWVYAGQVASTQIDVVGIYAGDYYIRVRANNPLGVSSLWTTVGPLALQGKTNEPPLVEGLRTETQIFGIRVRWGVPVGAEDTAFTELQYNSTPDAETATSLGRLAYPTDDFLLSGLAAAVTRWFRARLIDKTGNIGAWSPWVFGTSSGDASDILTYLTGQITATELGQGLLTEIEKISGNGPGSVNVRIEDGDNILQSQVDALNAQVADITGAPDWSDTEAYLAGSLVKFDGSLYRAVQDVPAGTPLTNTAYWENIGDYASLGELVTALAVRIDEQDQQIATIDGQVTALSTSVDGVVAYVYPPMAGSTNDYAGGTTGYAGVWSIQSAFASEDLVLAQRIDTIEASVGEDVAARITEETEARVTADTALAQQITTLESTVGGNTALIQQEASARADADSALAETVDSVQATVGENTAAIEVTSSALADTQNGLQTMYSVKLGLTSDGRYYAAGMGIGIENTPAGMQSQVLFLADRFAVMHSAEPGATPVVPFVVQGGQVFINSAVISKATIQEAIVGATLKSETLGTTGLPILSVDFDIGQINVRSNSGRLRVQAGKLDG